LAGLKASGLLLTLAAGTLLGRAPCQTVTLVPFLSGDFRWRDVADNRYAAAYRYAYSYDQATVTVTYRTVGRTLAGRLTARNLKPNFAYQVKLFGLPETDARANEHLGFSGRWWREEWNGWRWDYGQNLNDKGFGLNRSSNPNDHAYRYSREIADTTSPTGRWLRFTGYRLFDYFITDAHGNATLTFDARGSYHVLWTTEQLGRGRRDGPVKAHFCAPTAASPAYERDHRPVSVRVYGEWERLPSDGIPLAPGAYTVDLLLTEESFHSTLEWGGCWAHACRQTLAFTILPPATSVLPLR